MSKWIDVDYSKCEIYRQCEIRRPFDNTVSFSPVCIELPIKDRPLEVCQHYYFDIVWIKNNIARKGITIIDAAGIEWLVSETYSAKPIEGTRWDFKVKVL